MLSELPATSDEFLQWNWDDVSAQFEALQAAPLDDASVDAWMAGWTRLSELIGEAYARLYVAVTDHTDDPEIEARFNSYLDRIYQPTQAADQRLKEKLLASGLEPQGFRIPLLKMRSDAEIFRADNLPLQSQERKLSSEYNKIIGAQTVMWERDEVTLQQLRVAQHSPDRGVREHAWRLSAERQLADRQAIDALWARLHNLRLQQAANAGSFLLSGAPDYRAYRWQQMLRLDYTVHDAEVFSRAIEQVAVPAATRMYQKHAGRQPDGRLRPWDLDLDLYPLDMPPLPAYGSVDDLAEKAEDIFRSVDPSLGEYFHTMRIEDLLSIENHKGKAPGAYCTSYAVRKRPFVFMNAVGLDSDVRTILHESGHAFHNYERFRLPYVQQRTPGLEFAEVASMAMELLAAPHLDAGPNAFYGRTDARRFRIAHLERQLAFWPYMAVVDSFQHWIYTHPEQSAGATACDAVWLDLWQHYLPGVDWSGLDAEAMTGWHRKQHIHRSPFYYIEYGLAQLGAVQVWENSLSDPQHALSQYRAALALGGTVTLPELYRAAGARLAFDAETLGKAVDLIERTIASLEAGD